MKPSVRHYDRAADFDEVGRFLVRTYRTGGGHVNWLQPRWEYMHYHPLIRGVELSAIGVWEANGRIVGAVHPEHGMGTAHVEVDPAWDAVKGDMLRYAEEHLVTCTEGVRKLRVFINEEDDDLQGVASRLGYVKAGRGEEMSSFAIPARFPEILLRRGFRLKSLAEDNDLVKMNRLLWRGFNHGEEPPNDGVEDRRFMQSAPSFRPELNVVVEAPDGGSVSYCGTWYEPVHSIAYVEPVCTDPAYRRMGLGRAAVLEGIRRCGELGATVAYVGTTKPFYLSLGFRRVYGTSLWKRQWRDGGTAGRTS